MMLRFHKEKSSKYLKKVLKEAEEDRKLGRYQSLKSADKALKFIDEIINKRANA